jgi:uncharacterized damage-inducible protein DinB
MPRIALPAADEYLAYYAKYLAVLDVDDVLPLLAAQAGEVAKLLAATSEERAAHRYAPGKWSVKEVVGHLIDGERVFSYRALRFARADATDLPGFDENAYVAAAGFDRRPLAELAAEFALVRAATVAFYRGLDEAALLRRGTANGGPASVRALAAIIAGHTQHHVGLLRERYGLTG